MSDFEDLSKDTRAMAKSIKELSDTVSILAKDVVSNLRSRVEHFEAFVSVESRIIEREVTKRAMAYFEERGYIVDLLPFQKIVNKNGLVVVEWDGIFVVEPSPDSETTESYLCLVEAKHKVANDHIGNRIEYLGKFQKELEKMYFYDSNKSHYLSQGKGKNTSPSYSAENQSECMTENMIPRASWRSLCGALAPFKNYRQLLFLGGPEFTDQLIDKALKESIMCISTNGSRYDVIGNVSSVSKSGAHH